MFQTDRRARLRCRWLGGLTLGVLLSAGPGVGAWGQAADELPQAIVEKAGAWSPAEARAVEGFIGAQLDAFERDDAEAITAARDALLLPLNDLRAEASFQSQYFRALAAALRAGLGEFSKVGRINAMVLGPRVVDASVVPVLETGLTDDWAGVRYAGARSLSAILGNEAMGLRDNERTRLVERLGAAVATERDGFVAGKMIEGIRNSEVAGVRRVLLDVFNARVPLHAADPSLSYQPELSAIQEVFIDGLGTFGRDESRVFIRAVARYIRLATSQIAAGTLPEANQSAARGMVQQSYTVLGQLAGELNLPGRAPDNPGPFLNGDAERAAELAEQWVAFLGQGPVNLSAEELSIDAPAGESDEVEAAATD